MNSRTPLVRADVMAGCCLLLLAAVLSNTSGFDLWLERLFFDAPHHLFFYRDTQWMVAWLHDGLKTLAGSVWLALLVLAVFRRVLRPVPLGFDKLAYVVLASGLSAVLVAALKQSSQHSCPWDLIEFGGIGQFYLLVEQPPLWPDGLSAAGPGKCFPSGHASTGGMWICVLFVFERSQILSAGERCMRWGAVGAVVLTGFVSSAVQIVRGAHFLSHVLATALICLVVAWAVDAGFRWMRRSGRAAHSVLAG